MTRDEAISIARAFAKREKLAIADEPDVVTYRDGSRGRDGQAHWTVVFEVPHQPGGAGHMIQVLAASGEASLVE